MKTVHASFVFTCTMIQTRVLHNAKLEAMSICYLLATLASFRKLQRGAKEANI